MKKLIVCFDGTWNSPTQEDNGVPAPTNVYKFYRALATNKDGVEQRSYYHTGVGTEGGKISQILDGAFGLSLGEHIESAYHWLADNYEEGDHIYLIGFSRGAFTVRSLAGLIHTSGLIDLKQIPKKNFKTESKAQWSAVKKAYTAYRKGKRHLREFQKDNANYFFSGDGKVEIQFLGVWDTVGAAGIPDDAELVNAIFDRKSKWEFHDKRLNERVKIARHGMALDEMRSSFTVTRWENASSHENAKEVWFPGVHCDVGGGYAETQLSDIALKWMLDEAASADLAFKTIDSQLNPDPTGIIHNSYKGVFAALRSRPRNVHIIEETNSHIHESVFKRQKADLINYPAYWPTIHMEVGDEPQQISIYAAKHWNHTGIYFKKGEKYTFSASGEWVDKTDKCDWIGTEDDQNFTIGDIVRFGGTLLGKTEFIFKNKNPSTDFWGTKRHEDGDWFSMVGAIANDSGKADEVKNDGSPTPHEYFNLPDYDGSFGEPFVVKHSGYFYAFANDAWHFYDNNKGSIRLTIKRVE